VRGFAGAHAAGAVVRQVFSIYWPRDDVLAGHALLPVHCFVEADRERVLREL